MSKLETQIRKLSLQKGDILIVEKGYTNSDWVRLLQEAGKAAGVDFNVPIVFVDDVDCLRVVRFN
jgi:hypothetical protein